MPRSDKTPGPGKRQAGAVEPVDQPKGVPGPQAGARGWANASKLHGGGKKADSRRQLPSGPLGGSGRKTNRSRSS